MKMKKALIVTLTSIILTNGIFVGTSNTPALANIRNTTSAHLTTINENYYKENVITYSFWSKITKAAIKKAISNKRRVIEFVEKVTDKTIAKKVDKFFSPIVSALKPLLEWSEIPGDAVYDAVFRAIIKAGGSRSIAANIANAIREILEWTLF